MLKKVRTLMTAGVTAGAVAASASVASAGTPPFFVPLTESAPVTAANSDEEMNQPWITPANITQENLTSMDEIEGDIGQSVVRVPGVGRSASMWDMVAFDPRGRYVFIPHETPFGAGVSRYDMRRDETVTLFAGDQGGAEGDWTADYAAFDPSTFTPNKTLLLAEEWSGEGRVLEVLNPFASPAGIQVRELESIANVAHEGLRFSADGKTLYFVDEWRSGSIYKFVMAKPRDYTRGQTFVLVVDAFDGNPADNYNDDSNVGATRTGAATWVPITDPDGNPLTSVDPFRNGPTNDPRANDDTRGGRPAADEVNGTPYGRPEDMEIGKLASGNEVMYFAATSERTIYSVEMLSDSQAMVRVAASDADTPKNLGFAPTTGELNSPDNLAQDAFGNIYIIEDAPNGSSTGGDIWFLRDTDSDGVAESVDHFLSIRVAGSEATGMIFNPRRPSQFVVAVQHPSSTDLDSVPSGFGDALWLFDLSKTSFVELRDEK
ncbi:MAG: DUF839 domain-containing protein [Myxococcales bacterium]|nr:DUF839 domain-containing protein [Myxococcales bacterium]